MNVPDSLVMLRDLIERATQPQFVYAHQWQCGDVVMWDNRSTMHRGRRFDETQVRDLRRLTTADAGSTMDFGDHSLQGHQS